MHPLWEAGTSVNFHHLQVDTGVCSWVVSIFTLGDDKFLAKCGMDAVQYLKFQRSLIIFVLIMMIVCIGIILPINFQVEVEGCHPRRRRFYSLTCTISG